MTYAVLTALLWALMTSFWMDAEKRARPAPREIVVLTGRDLTITHIPTQQA